MRIQVFARAPRAGETKTRLIPALGAEGAARLHERLIRRTLQTAQVAAPDVLELWCTPDTTHPLFRDYERHHGVRLRVQSGDDLGARMRHALADAGRCNEVAVLVGTDCPALDAQHLRRAAAWLEEGADLVLGPAEDGGYVLIGAGRADAALFTGVPWGGTQVLRATLERAERLGLAVRLLPVLADLDRPEDLDRFADLIAEL